MSNEIWMDRIFEPKGESTVMDFDVDDVIEERAFFEHPRYADLEPISRGAFGDVRRVRDLRTLESTAMKLSRRCIVLESRAYFRFAMEIEIMRSLQHPGILPVQEHGEFDDGRLWFTMPEIRGRCYAAILGELHTPLMANRLFNQAIKTLVQFCPIMAHAHEQGIIHRDLKPKNLMVADDGANFVIDWGLAKQLATKESKARICTEPGEVLGTPAYMPPEQAFGDIAMQSPASDVYSLGAILYHLLTGQPPYRGTRPAVIAQIKRGPPNPISAVIGSTRSVPRELVELSEVAMQRQPAKRTVDPVRFGEVIQEWLDKTLTIDS